MAGLPRRIIKVTAWASCLCSCPVGVPGGSAPRFLPPAARGRRPEAARRGFGCGGEGSRVLGRGRRGDFRPQWGSRVAAIGGPQEAPPRAGKAWPAPRRRVGLRCCGTLVLGAGLRGLSDHPRIECAGIAAGPGLRAGVVARRGHSASEPSLGRGGSAGVR